jgi:hypothetical protein
VPQLVEALLCAIGETEPAVLNYMATRADAATLEQLDTARAAAARASPLMDAVHNCLRLLTTGAQVRAVGARIAGLVRSSVALTTRTAACSSLGTLCTLHSHLLLADQSIVDAFLPQLVHALSERNATVRRQASTTIGRCIKYAQHRVLHDIFMQLTRRIINDEAEGELRTCSITAHIGYTMRQRSC